MAGSIPPLVSSTPPPLGAFDDDEEEEEDEFGLYTGAEDIEYNECISFKEKNDEKQCGEMSRGEQDSTSQDSATDSGLCPDSEGVSPTPHSDEERTVRHSVTCDEVCQQPTNRLNSTQDLHLSSGFPAETGLPNGHILEEDSEDDFGNFENFENTAPSLSEQSYISKREEEPKLNLPASIVKEEIISVDLQTEEIIEVKDNNRELEGLTEQNVSFEECKTISSPIEFCANVETQQISDSLLSELDVTSTNDDDLNCKEQYASLEEEHTIINANSNVKIEQEKETKENIDEFDQQDEFDDFSDFQADFSNFAIPNAVQCDNISEHSIPIIDQKHLEESAKTVCDSVNDASDEEFSDFTEFSSSHCAFVSAQESNSVENVSHIPIISSDDSDIRTDSEFQDWVSVFPSSSNDSAVEDGEDVVILRDNDPVWTRLIPMESSPALSYQWTESRANRHLLSALNIDSRNILMMPWMPKFAANLSCGPLQPVKAPEPLQPTPAPAAAPLYLSSGPESVPDAHFDWVGSGLTNPLDGPKPVLKLQSPEAETVLSTLPDLSFMRKAYIDFPINKG